MRLRAPGLALLVLCAGCAPHPGPPTAPEPLGSTSPSAVATSTPGPTAPLVLAVHHSRPAGSVPLATARALVERRTGSWAELGQPGAEIRVIPDTTSPAAAVAEVTGDPAALALVPAEAVDERVRVLAVDGVDPLREPHEYALRTPAPAAATPRVTTITVVGDIMLGRRVGRGITADPAAPFRPFAARLSAADVTVGNFESTLSRNGSPTQGGDSFAADPAVLAGLQLAGIDGVSLANNHLGDYGITAMRETFTRFDAAGIAYFGAGVDLSRARAPWIVEAGGVRIGFLGTESIGETPAAGADRPGTNRLNMPPRTGPLDTAALDRIAADISALRSRVDTVIVLPHWGTQYTHLPEPVQHEVAARFAAAGADLVVGGHPHWVQGWEVSGDTTVVHSLGNFIFDMEFSREVQEGIFVEIVLWDGAVKAVEPVPYVIEGHIPRPADADRSAKILADVRRTSTGPYAG